MKVLIVDDHAAPREALARLVGTWGHEVAVAENGERALALAATFHPDFAILDLSMPGMDGIVLARCLRKAFPAGRLRLIALSGHSSADVREACLAAGFEECLNKTGSIEPLERLLDERT